MALILQARTWGSGPLPALLLHGFTGSSHSFDHLTPLLGDCLTAVVPDLPGHAGAPLPARLDEAGFAEAIDALAALAGGPRVVLGYSQGARLAIALAARRPEVVSHLILESGSPGLRRQTDRLKRQAEDDKRAAKLETEGVDRFMAWWETLGMFQGIRELPEDLRSLVDQRRRSHTAAGLAGALRGLGTGTQPSYWQSLRGFTMPVLILTGTRDKKFTAIGRRIRRGIPGAQHATFRGAWHAPHLERPAEYAAEVRRFIGCDGRAAG